MENVCTVTQIRLGDGGGGGGGLPLGGGGVGEPRTGIIYNGFLKGSIRVPYGVRWFWWEFQAQVLGLRLRF